MVCAIFGIVYIIGIFVDMFISFRQNKNIDMIDIIGSLIWPLCIFFIIIFNIMSMFNKIINVFKKHKN
jgi:uncharacterized Tic20 family protein